VSDNTAFINKMKESLRKRSIELRTILSDANQHVSDSQVKDSGDEALTTSMDSLQNSLTQSEVEEFNEIEAALARIERNEYGFCIECGDAITEKRLTYSPFAARCIICQEELEQTAR